MNALDLMSTMDRPTYLDDPEKMQELFDNLVGAQGLPQASDLWHEATAMLGVSWKWGRASAVLGLLPHFTHPQADQTSSPEGRHPWEIPGETLGEKRETVQFLLGKSAPTPATDLEEWLPTGSRTTTAHQARQRVNVGKTSTGKYSAETTVEVLDGSTFETVEEQDAWTEQRLAALDGIARREIERREAADGPNF